MEEKRSTRGGQARRDRLKQAAQDAVQQSGLRNLSFRTLADDIGIKSSSVHYHFPEKADLARALIQRYSRDFAQSVAVAEATAGRGSLRKKLTGFIGIFDAVAKDDRMCLCGMMAAEIDELNESNRTLLKAYFNDTERALTALFTAHREELASDLPPKTLAALLLAGLEGALLLDRATGGRERLRAQRTLALSWLASAR